MIITSSSIKVLRTFARAKVQRACFSTSTNFYKIDGELDGKQLLAKHNERFENELDHDEIIQVIRDNTLFSWNPSGTAANNALTVTKGDGVFFYDAKGKKYLDFNSQAMCSNLGHTVPQEVKDEINTQLNSIAYSYPCATVTPIKAKLSALLADIFPGDINHFFYTSGGAESNETALRMARLYTGRHKVLARYRSYHGGTLGAMALTGDPRRWPSEPSATGVVHFMDPYPYTFSWGENHKDAAKRNMHYVKETIMYEGPRNIAAIFVESVTGTNGVLIPPKGYLEELRKICDEYEILLVCDEVMNGFGRTGKMFGFMHTSPEIIPDIVTMAKGINGAYVPLGAVGCRDKIASYFQTNPISIGSTYNSHPIGLASAYGVLKYMLKNDVIAHVQQMAPILKQLQTELKEKHPTIKAIRSTGLFGIIDLQKNNKGDPFVVFNGQQHPAINQFKNDLLNYGLFTLIRWSSFFTNPPLIIKEKELTQGFEIIDKALTTLDKSYEKL